MCLKFETSISVFVLYTQIHEINVLKSLYSFYEYKTTRFNRKTLYIAGGCAPKSTSPRRRTFNQHGGFCDCVVW